MIFNELLKAITTLLVLVFSHRSNTAYQSLFSYLLVTWQTDFCLNNTFLSVSTVCLDKVTVIHYLLFISWSGRNFYVYFSVHQGSTGSFLLFQYPSGVVWHPRKLHNNLTTLFLFRPYLCFIVGFILDEFVARNDSWMR